MLGRHLEDALKNRRPPAMNINLDRHGLAVAVLAGRLTGDDPHQRVKSDPRRAGVGVGGSISKRVTLFIQSVVSILTAHCP